MHLTPTMFLVIQFTNMTEAPFLTSLQPVWENWETVNFDTEATSGGREVSTGGKASNTLLPFNLKMHVQLIFLQRKFEKLHFYSK